MATSGIGPMRPIEAVDEATFDDVFGTNVIDKLCLGPETKAAFDDFMSKRLLVGRKGAAEDVARLVGFLVSPASGFITGACMPIDGGMGVT